MADTSGPDIGDIATQELPEGAFPADASQPAPRELRVTISEQAHREIVAHAREDQQAELCGVLVGAVRRDRHGPFVAVEAIIRGEHAESHSGQVTFTHDTWAHINAVMDRDFPEARIVGWYHTHPGLAVFLSQMDLFIQRHFFDQPWQVAFVVDPQSGEQAFFHWLQGQPTRGRRFWIGATEQRAEPVPAVEAAVRPAPVVAGGVPRGMVAALAGLALLLGAALTLVATTFLGPLSAHEREESAQIRELERANTALLEELARLGGKVDALQRDLAAARAEMAPAAHQDGAGAAAHASGGEAALILKPPPEAPADDGK